MGVPLARWDNGVSLRTYLTALLLVPLLTCVGFAGYIISAHLRDARAAEHAVRLVRQAGRLSVAQRDVQAELVPDVLHTVLSNPVLRGLAGLTLVGESRFGVTDHSVAVLQARADAALRQDGIGPVGASLRHTLTDARRDIASVASLATGYRQLVTVSSKLSTAEHAAVTQAARLGLGSNVSAALSSLRLTDEATRYGVQELVMLDSLQFGILSQGALGSGSVSQGRALYARDWAAFEAASSRVLSQASTPVATRWRAALALPASRSFDKVAAQTALGAHPAMSVDQLVTVQRQHSERSTALAAVESAGARQAEAAADAQGSSAVRSAMSIGLLVALVTALSGLVAWWVRRSITRPLNALAGQAALVSHGELVDVQSVGPREIRTVASGLGSAVDSLRKVEKQAAAVASGDLESDIVRRPLVGPLGAVMHRSITTIIDAIHDRDMAQSDLAYRATHDALTGLPNRTQALLATKHALQQARRAGAGTCLMFVDLDRFKVVNDTFGHAAGDAVLRVTAERMSAIVRDTDTVFRLGGDEFVVLLEDTDHDFAYVALAERLIGAISEPVRVTNGIARIGASIGISVSQDASVDPEQLLNESDAAAYSVKHSGRGKVGIYDDALRTALLERAELERALEQALDEDEFVLHYQPVVELDTGRLSGFEALIRWNRPGIGLWYPDSFVPVAEKSSLINRIDRWALDAATRQLAEWDRGGQYPSSLTMAVNVSGRHLSSSELVSDVRCALAAAELHPRRLVVEVTETVLVDDPRALANMQALRALGVVVAIDDFGTGYTSIGQLSNLPVDVIKIDRSFTASTDDARRKLVRLIVEAAHAFRLAVVGEGIELVEQRDALASIHTDLGQGYYFGRPQPTATVASAEVGERTANAGEGDADGHVIAV